MSKEVTVKPTHTKLCLGKPSKKPSEPTNPPTSNLSTAKPREGLRITGKF